MKKQQKPKTAPTQNKKPIWAEISPQESQKQANQLTFHDPDEEQIIASYKEKDNQGGRPPPEYDPKTKIYTYGMDRDPNGECKTNSYYMLKIKSNKNEEEIPKHHEREDEY